jgi:hypothetical protein
MDRNLIILRYERTFYILIPSFFWHATEGKEFTCYITVEIMMMFILCAHKNWFNSPFLYLLDLLCVLLSMDEVDVIKAQR